MLKLSLTLFPLAGKSALENLILDTKEWLRFNRTAGAYLCLSRHLPQIHDRDV